MPRLALLASATLAAVALAVFLPVLVSLAAALRPTIAEADSSEALTERYIARTFRAMADTVIDAPSNDVAAAAISTLIRNEMVVDETARFVLARDRLSENPAAGGRFRGQFVHFATTASATVTLKQQPGNFAAVAAMFDRLAVRAGAPAPSAAQGCLAVTSPKPSAKHAAPMGTAEASYLPKITGSFRSPILQVGIV